MCRRARTGRRGDSRGSRCRERRTRSAHEAAPLPAAVGRASTSATRAPRCAARACPPADAAGRARRLAGPRRPRARARHGARRRAKSASARTLASPHRRSPADGAAHAHLEVHAHHLVGDDLDRARRSAAGAGARRAAQRAPGRQVAQLEARIARQHRVRSRAPRRSRSRPAGGRAGRASARPQSLRGSRASRPAATRATSDSDGHETVCVSDGRVVHRDLAAGAERRASAARGASRSRSRGSTLDALARRGRGPFEIHDREAGLRVVEDLRVAQVADRRRSGRSRPAWSRRRAAAAADRRRACRSRDSARAARRHRPSATVQARCPYESCARSACLPSIGHRVAKLDRMAKRRGLLGARGSGIRR